MAVVSSSCQVLSSSKFTEFSSRKVKSLEGKKLCQSSFSGKSLSATHSPLITRPCRKVCGASLNSQGYTSPITSQTNWDYETAHGVSSIWSIRRDLKVPYSALMGVYANQGQPSPMVQERFQSVISQLFQNRIIRCGGGVDDDMANLIVAQLLYLDAADPDRDIIMYVNSPGGSVTAGMAIFDTMRHIRPSVSTVCVGLAASMGAFLLSAGTKGKRYSLPNSRIMIHQPLGGAQGQQTDIEIQANEILHHKANLNGYLAYHTGQSYEKITQDTDRDFFMSAKEAQAYGLIDAVITNPLKALKPLTPEEEGRLFEETAGEPVKAVAEESTKEGEAAAPEQTASEEAPPAVEPPQEGQGEGDKEEPSV